MGYKKMTKYKAGDEVTIVLMQPMIDRLNSGHAFYCPEDLIISHKPAPEEMPVWINMYADQPAVIFGTREAAFTYRSSGYFLNVIKLTYNPSTKTATAEVV